VIKEFAFRTRDRIKQRWRDNGTALIGQFWVALGTIAAVDHEQLHQVIDFVGPAWGPRLAYCVSIIGGIVTWRRALTNAERIARGDG
jgi:hypothetical protein